MLISLVIPVYDSAVLAEIADRIDRVFADLPEEYEIIFVDDFSPNPKVWTSLLNIVESNSHVRAIQLTRNFGQHAATLCGLTEARGDFVITMDDDLQHSPEDIPRFLELRNYDVVIAQFKNKHHGILKRISSRVKGLFDQLIIGKPKSLDLTSFRMLNRKIVEGMLLTRTAHPFVPTLIFHVTKNITGLEVEHHKRAVGKSAYDLGKQFRLLNDLIFSNSSLILRMVGYVGLLFASGSFLMTLIIIYRKLLHRISVQGWASLFVAILFVGGLLLLGMGVIGEYLIRIIESSETRPSFFVRQQVGRSDCT